MQCTYSALLASREEGYLQGIRISEIVDSLNLQAVGAELTVPR